MGQVLIDEQLIFDEDRFLLFRVGALDEAPLRLGAIASRCFSVMLKSKDDVVRKRELMAGAWGSYGLEVTDNSLAQVVRQLRLALEKLQPDRDFIQTVPRIGYRLIDGVRVEELSCEPLSALLTCEGALDNEAFVQVGQRKACGNDIAVQVPSMSEVKVLSAEKLGVRLSRALSMSSHRRGWLALLAWGLLAFLSGAIGLIPSGDSIQLDFAAASPIGGVQVYRSTSDLNPQPASSFQSLIPRSQKIAVLLGISFDKLHLYLLPAGEGADQIFCDGELQSPQSRCIGVQPRG
jgi:DNA-binding winged helix-turn-helix (wHTH) protein